MFFFRIFAIALMMLAMPAHAQEKKAERPEVAKYAKVFRGPEGMAMALVGVGKPENEEYLLQYYGINHDWDKKIFKVKRVPAGMGFDYRMIIDGRDYITIVQRPRGGGHSTYYAYLYHGPRDQSLSYDEEASRQVLPEHFLTAYLKQEGVIKD